MPTSAQDLVRRYAECVNGKDVPGFLDLFHADVTLHDAAAPGGLIEGVANLQQFLAGNLAAFPDFTIVVDAVLNTTGDEVAWRGAVRGTVQGGLNGAAATGKRFSVPIAELYRLVDGKIQEAWIYLDMLDLLTQLGVIPARGEAATA